MVAAYADVVRRHIRRDAAHGGGHVDRATAVKAIKTQEQIYGMEITLSINKEEVMQEIAVTTAYTGGKMEGDENAMRRISTVDEDETHLERFWEESRTDICQELIGLVAYEGVRNHQYELRLNVSNSFDEALLPSMRLSLFSYFVHNMVAKWYIYTNKKEAGDYADKASTLLDDIHRKAVYKKKPTRPTYDD